MASPQRGYMLAMPVLVLNLGVEMVYILEQRLRAQNIPPEKAKKVLTDVVRAMLAPSFLAEVFRPQELYTARALRAVFERLAHSSIMRLNGSSMAKLYDLMTMGVKYQILAAGDPLRASVDVALRHLDTLREMLTAQGAADAAALPAGGAAAGAGRDGKAVAGATGITFAAGGEGAADKAQAKDAAKGTPAGSSSGGGDANNGTVADLLDAGSRTIRAVYGTLPQGELWGLHAALLRFFQDRRVKVSLFLQDGLQHSDSTLVLPPSGPSGAPAVRPLPRGTDTPGTVRYFDASGKQVGATATLPSLAALHASAAQQATAAAAASPTAQLALGSNMYAKDRSRKTGTTGAAAGGAAGAGAAADALAMSPAGASARDAGASSDSPAANSRGGAEGKAADAEAEAGGLGGSRVGAGHGHGLAGLNLLASLLGPPPTPGGASGSSSSATVPLFLDDDFESDGYYGLGASGVGGAGGGVAAGTPARRGGADADGTPAAKALHFFSPGAGAAAAEAQLRALDLGGPKGAAAAGGGSGGAAEGKAAADDDLLSMLDAVS